MFIMSYFRTVSEALHLAVSEDGLRWRPLNKNRPVLSGTVGTKTLRDPSLFRSRDGVFHLLATNGWMAGSIVHASSQDLIHWPDQELVPVMGAVLGTKNCWAPECFYDAAGDCYRVIWSSTVKEDSPDALHSDHRIWGATTTDFHTYSPAHLFFDPGYNVIDASVVAFDGWYWMAFKDERGENRFGTDYKAIRFCRSRTGGGPWTEISELITPALTEGPTLFHCEGRWIMLFDHFLQDFFGAMESLDCIHWSAVGGETSFPEGARHPTVIEVEDELAARVFNSPADVEDGD